MLPDDMQLALRNLTDDTVSTLVAIDKMPYPDRSSAYELRPIFEHEDAQQIFSNIKALSNRGRNEFSTFLSAHYMFNYHFTSDSNRYAADRSVLVHIKELVDAEFLTTSSVDRYVYSLMSTHLARAIKRAEGAAVV